MCLLPSYDQLGYLRVPEVDPPVWKIHPLAVQKGDAPLIDVLIARHNLDFNAKLTQTGRSRDLTTQQGIGDYLYRRFLIRIGAYHPQVKMNTAKIGGWTGLNHVAG